MLVCAFGCTAAVGEELDLRIQIEWGGRADETWEGRVSIDQGRFSDLQLLGIDAAAPGSILLRRQHLIVHQDSPMSLNGAIISVNGNSDSTLRFEFVGSREPRAKVMEIKLGSLVGLTDRAKNFDLDDSGNQLWVRRLAGDEVRVAINRRHLVFQADEDWSIDILPHHLPVKDRAPRECRLKLLNTAGDEQWSDSLPMQSSVRGRIPPIRNIEIDVPQTEGVFTLQIELVAPARRFAPPFRSERAVARRSVQLVVLEKERPVVEATSQDDHVVFEFDPAEDRWWDRLKLLPQWSILPGLRHDGPLGNRKPEKFRHGESTWVKIRPGGWQAYPLPIDDLEERHEVTIEYPGDISQTTTFSIVEPNAAGKVLPIGLDSGVRVDERSVNGIAARPPKKSQHTISFWPTTKSPLLLVTNVDPTDASIVGQIRVSRISTPPAITRARNEGHRKLIANFDRPLFVENFSATDQIDPNTNRTFEDWTTFYQGGRRMVEYLRQNGFDGIAMSCFAEGSSLYPDTNVQPTTKYDRGIFFSDGRDPLRKDVMEMLFRLCDRENLTLIPTFEFSTRLPTLEAILREDRNSAEGVRLVNHLGQTTSESTLR